MRAPILLSLLAGLAIGFVLTLEASGQPDKKITNTPWVPLEPGLFLGTFKAPQASIAGNSLIRILKIDPQAFDFHLLNASSPKQGQRHSPRNWSIKNGLTAAINASMYQADRRASVSYMKTKNHINNPRMSKDKAFLAFHSKDKSLAKVQILDKDCQDVNSLQNKYYTLIQSIRMISCDGKNVWQQQKKRWSLAVIGMDKNGMILFIHSRSPYSTHDFINILLKLPIDIKRAMYVEGGPEAQLYINSGKEEFNFVGSYSDNPGETGKISSGLPIPNIVGITRISSNKK